MPLGQLSDAPGRVVGETDPLDRARRGILRDAAQAADEAYDLVDGRVGRQLRLLRHVGDRLTSRDLGVPQVVPVYRDTPLTRTLDTGNQP